MDDGCGIWENRKRAMLMFDPKASHHLVVQDDAIICKDFIWMAEREIEFYPDHAISFYFGNRKNMQEEGRRGEADGGVKLDWLSWGVAICLPTKIIPDLVKFWEGKDAYLRHDDTRIARYLRHIGMPVWYPIPSLIDHRADEKSLMDNSEGVKKRQAFSFMGE
jgi:hypothetical protein